VVVLDLSGKIMGGEETTMFHGKMHELIQSGKRKFIIDLKNVEWMNSVGLGMLISAFTTVKNAKGRLVLANITNIESILSMTPSDHSIRTLRKPRIGDQIVLDC